jgi:hypothetical protein
MINVQENFKIDLRTYGRQFNIKLKVNNSDFNADNLNYIKPSFTTPLFKTIMHQIELDSKVFMSKGTKISGRIGVKVNEKNYKYIDLNNYYVQSCERQEDTNSYRVLAYSKMKEAMVDYDLSFAGKITVRNYLIKVCERLGWNTDNIPATFINSEKMIDPNLHTGIKYSFRDALDEIATITCSFLMFKGDNFYLLYLTETNETIDESYLDEDNVTIGEKYLINSLVFSRAEESDNIYRKDNTSITANGLHEYRIADCQLLSTNDRADYIDEMFNYLKTLEFYIFDVQSKGILFLEACDLFNLKLSNVTYKVALLNDEINIDDGLTENLFLDKTEETETEYKYADSTDKRIDQAYILVDKQNKKITQLTKETTENSKKITKVEQDINGVTTKVSSVETEINSLKETTVNKVQVQYALSDSSTNAPETGWSTTAPVWESGKYMWQKTVTTYSDGSKTSSNPICIQGAKGETGASGSDGADGKDGENGKGILNTVVTYQTGTSGTKAPTGTWSTTIPNVLAGQFLWTKTVITYTDNTTSTSYSISRQGENGENYWKSNVTVDLTDTTLYDENKYYPVTGSNLGTTEYRNIKIYTTLGSSGKPSWSTHNSGFSANLELATLGSGWGTTNAECIIYSDNYRFCAVSPISFMQLTYSSTPVVYLRGGGKYYIKTDYACSWTIRPEGYTWTGGNYSQTAPVKDSRPTLEGTNIKGKDGKGIKSIQDQYYLSDSNTTQTGGTWKNTQDPWVSGKYIWTRSHITWSDNTTTDTTPVLASALNTANETAKDTANNLNNNYYTKTQTDSQITQKADEITQRINLLANLTQATTGTKTIVLSNCAKGNLLKLQIKGNNEVFKYLYPSDTLYPSNSLYPYGDSRILVNEVQYELGIIDVLRKNGNTYDEYILEEGQAKVIRRINVDGTIKTTPIVEELGEFSILLNEGTNTIKILNYTAEITAKYVIKSDYTEAFATKVEMNSSIEQTAEGINQVVRKKVDENEIISKINQTAEDLTIDANRININGTVSANGNFKVDTNGNMECVNAKINVRGGENTGDPSGLNLKVTNPNDNYNYSGLAPDFFIVRNGEDNYVNSEINKFGTSLQLMNSLESYITMRAKSGSAGTTWITSDSYTSVSSTGITTPTLTQTSKAESKKNFEKFTLKEAKEILNNTDIYKYNLKTQDDKDKKHIGFVIGDDYNYSEKITSEKNDGANIYSMTSVLYTVVQEQQKQIEALQQRVEKLEGGQDK